MPEAFESFPEDADRTMPSGRPPAVQNGVRDPARQARWKTWARRAEWDSAGAINVERLLEFQRIIVQPAVRKRTHFRSTALRSLKQGRGRRIPSLILKKARKKVVDRRRERREL